MRISVLSPSSLPDASATQSSSGSASPCRYRFLDFELNVASRELRDGDGQVTVLAARVFECLEHLIRNRDRAVGRDELAAVIWNRADVSDNMLAQLLTRTRRLLGDTGGEQRAIRTIAGFGYRWIADTEAIHDPPPPTRSVDDDESVAAPAAATVATTVRRSRYRSWLIPAALAAVLAGVVLRPGNDAPSTPLRATPAAPSSVAETADNTVLVLPAHIDSATRESWQQFGIMAMVGDGLHQAGRVVIEPGSAIALTAGIDPTALDTAALAQLADSAAAASIVLPSARKIPTGWRVEIASLFGPAVSPPRASAEASDLMEAARLATERLLALQGNTAHPARSDADHQLDIALKQAEGLLLAGDPSTARRHIEEAEKHFPESAEPGYLLARIDVLERKLEPAAQRLDQLLARTSADDNPKVHARLSNLRAIVCYWQDDAACVQSRAQTAIDLLQSVPDASSELGRSYFVRSMASFAEARWEAALADLARARTLWIVTGERLGIARVDSNTGIIYRQLGRTHEAIAVLTAAAQQLQAFHSDSDEAYSRKNLALALLDAGQPLDALQQEPRLRALAELNLSASLRDEFNLFRAQLFARAGVLNESAAILATFSTSPERASEDLHIAAATHALASGNFDAAESRLGQALNLAVANQCNPRGIANQFLALARLRARHDPGAANALRDDLLKTLGRTRYAQTTIFSHLIEAELAADDVTASRHYTSALALAEANAAPADLLAVAQGYVPWLLQRSQASEAAAVVGRLGNMPHQSYEAALLELQLFRATGPQQAWQAAYDRASALAGERPIPAELTPRSAP